MEIKQLKDDPLPAIESRFASIGRDLGTSVGALINSIPASNAGPVELARALGVDKVLTSRVLKATRNRDPIAVLHLIPGPEPLRRLIRAAGKRGAKPGDISAADAAVDEFESFIRREVGDRITMEAIISAWLPEARTEFEVRRKQSAFRAMSLLKGSSADVQMATVLIHPAKEQGRLDVVWLFGLFGLHRLRPGGTVRFASRRVVQEHTERRTETLTGQRLDLRRDLIVREFCSVPEPQLNVRQVGDVIHYTLAQNGFGPRSAVDVVFAEVNRAELPERVPSDQVRKRWVSAEVNTPAKVLVFDALVHRDVEPQQDPHLLIYDTANDGAADVNNPERDIDRFELAETIQSLGEGIAKFRTTEISRYAELLSYTCDRLNWDGDAFRGYRCRIEYPIYGSQVVMAWDAPRA